MLTEKAKMDSTICFCKYARPALIVWGYIKLILLLLASFPLYLALVLIIFYGTRLETTLLWLILITYPTALSFNISLIVAGHTGNVPTLKVCMYYLIAELILTLVQVPWILKVIRFDMSIYEYMESIWFTIGLTIVLMLQGIFSILLVHSELKKLSDEDGVAHEEVGYRNLKGVKEIS